MLILPHSSSNFIKKLTKLALCLCSTVALCLYGVQAQAVVTDTLDLATDTTYNAGGTGWTFANGTITFTTAAAGNEYTITGNGGTAVRSIVFATGANATINLDGVTINSALSPIDIQDTASVTINLTDGSTNSLAATAYSYAGISVATTASVTIAGATGILNVNSTRDGAAIGGVQGSGGGTITITGGMIYATCSLAWGVGIGGGDGEKNTAVDRTATTTISGGTVIAKGGAEAAGIGAGDHSTAGTIVITGNAKVTAIGGAAGGLGGGAGIGAGGAGTADSITIDATATVMAYSYGDRPAIDADASGNRGTGFYVNGLFQAANVSTNEMYIDAYAAGTLTAPITNLTVPAGYRGVAFTTGAAAAGNYNLYKVETTNGAKQKIAAFNAAPTNLTIPSQKTQTATQLTFTDAPIYNVTNANDAGAGSLRAAVDSINGESTAYANFIINVKSPFPDGTDSILLTSLMTGGESNTALVIKKKIVLYGNGVTISCGNSNLRAINVAPDAYLLVERVHFTGNALLNKGTLIVKSCIFSDAAANSAGGAIADLSGGTPASREITVMGCTFVNNRGSEGGAIALNANGSATIKLVGNLFYNNTATANNGQSVYKTNTATPTESYNIYDQNSGANALAFGGTGDVQVPTDILRTYIDLSAAHYQPTAVRASALALNIIPSLPADFPTTDFLGTTRTFPNGGTVGAVVAIDLEVTNHNNDGAGSLRAAVETVNSLPAGNYTINVTIPGLPWSGDSIVLTTAGDVGVASDAAMYSNKSCLVITGGKRVTLNGNGVAISGGGNERRLFLVDHNADLIVNRVHFRNVNATGTGITGGAIMNRGALTVESCIFSNLNAGTVNGGGEQTGNYGGAICHSNNHSRGSADSLNVSGCTFVNCKAAWGGAVILLWSTCGPSHFVGNLLYGNTALAANQGHTIWRDPPTVPATYDYNIWDNGNISAYEMQNPASTGTGNAKIDNDTLGTYLTGVTPNAAGIASGATGLNRVPSSAVNFVDFYGQTRDSTNGTVGAIKAIAYTVTYNGNGSTGGSMAQSTYHYIAKERLRANAFTRTDHTFLGWSIGSAQNAVDNNPGVGAVTLTDTALVSDLIRLTGLPNGTPTVNLYAVWKPNHYTLTFNANGGSVSPTSLTVASDAAAGTLPTPTRTDKYNIFNGWYNGSNLYDSNTPLTADITLIAHWVDNNGRSSDDGVSDNVTDATKDASKEGDYYVVNNCDIDAVYIKFTKGDNVESITILSSGTVVKDSIIFDISRPNVYVVNYLVYLKNGEYYEAQIKIEKRFKFNDIVRYKGNMLFVSNNPLTNNNYNFIAYQWHRNGQQEGTNQYYYKGGASQAEAFLLTDTIKLILTTDNNERIGTCAGTVNVDTTHPLLRAYPNPVSRGELFTLDIPEENTVQEVLIYNTSGGLINTHRINNSHPQIKIDAPQGFYIIQAGKLNTTIVVR